MTCSKIPPWYPTSPDTPLFTPYKRRVPPEIWRLFLNRLIYRHNEIFVKTSHNCKFGSWQERQRYGSWFGHQISIGAIIQCYTCILDDFLYTGTCIALWNGPILFDDHSGSIHLPFSSTPKFTLTTHFGKIKLWRLTNSFWKSSLYWYGPLWL